MATATATPSKPAHQAQMAAKATPAATARQQLIEDKKAVVGAQREPAFQISRLGEQKKYLKLLVYGTYGAGKTVLTASAAEVPGMRDVLIISAESGDLSIITADRSEEASTAIDVVTCTDFKQAARVQEFLRVHCQLRDGNEVDKLIDLERRFVGGEDPIDTPRRYHTVIIDSLSEIEAYNMYGLLGVTNRMKLDDEVQAAEWAEYRANNTMMQRFVRAFRDLPMHVLVTCAEQYDQDETKRMLFRPALTGKLSKQVQGFMDMVGYLMVGSPGENGISPRRLYIQPNAGGRFDAKNRFSSYRGSYFDNPTIESICKAVRLNT